MISVVKSFTSVLSVATVVGMTAFSLSAQAAIVTVPSGLNPGDRYRLVFVTDGRRDPLPADIADYNSFVTNQVTGSALEASLIQNGLTPQWFAIASTATVNARTNTGTDPTLPAAQQVPIYLISDSIKVADSYSDLWDGSIDVNIDSTPSGSRVVGSVWTGTDEFGFSVLPFGFLGESPASSLDPQMPGVGARAIAGGTSADAAGIGTGTGPRWVSNQLITYCQVDCRRNPPPLLLLYGISSELVVPGSPSLSVVEPSSLLSCITLGGLILGSAVRRARK